MEFVGTNGVSADIFYWSLWGNKNKNDPNVHELFSFMLDSLKLWMMIYLCL